MMSYDLPQWVRNRVGDDTMKSSLDNSRIRVTSKIESEIKSTKSSDEIAKKVTEALSPQIKIKIKEIRYVIESR